MDSKTKIEELINSSKVFVFMKGTPKAPACGFSHKIIEALEHLNISFAAYNILEDPELRQAVKEHANWPTYPQLYIDGKFVGGCDIVTQLAESGELKGMVQ